MNRRSEPQYQPSHPAGQPENREARRMLVERLLLERFGGMRHWGGDVLRGDVVPLWDGLTPTTGPGSVLPVPTTRHLEAS